jgi:hypothetical protein
VYCIFWSRGLFAACISVQEYWHSSSGAHSYLELFPVTVDRLLSG